MIKAIVITELDVLEGAEAMELGVRIAVETEYKYVWHRDMNRLVLGNVALGTISGSSPATVLGVLTTYDKGRQVYKAKGNTIQVCDWGQEVII